MTVDIVPAQSDAAETELGLMEAVASTEKLGRYHHRRLEALESMADFLTRRWRWIEAEPLKVQILAVKEKLHGPEHHSLAPAMAELAVGYKAMGQWAQAEAVLFLSLKIFERDAVENSATIAETLAAIAEIMTVRGRWPDAEIHLIRAQKITRIVFGAEAVPMVRLLTRWGATALAAGEIALARSKWGEAEALSRRVSGEQSPGTANVWMCLGRWARDRKYWSEAEGYFRRALAVHETDEGAWGPSVGSDLLSLGILFNAIGGFRRAETALGRARDIRENILGPDHPQVAEVLGPWAEALAGRDQFERAEDAYGRAWRVFEKCFGPESPALLRTMNNLAELYFRRSADAAAERLLRRTAAVTEKIYGPTDPMTTRALRNLLLTCEASDRGEEAEAVRRKLAAVPLRRRPVATKRMSMA